MFNINEILRDYYGYIPKVGEEFNVRPLVEQLYELNMISWDMYHLFISDERNCGDLDGSFITEWEFAYCDLDCRNLKNPDVTKSPEEEMYLVIYELINREISKGGLLVDDVKKQNDKQVKIGVWTPQGRTLCLECHGPKFPTKLFDINSEEWIDLIQPMNIKDYYDVTICDYCDQEIQVHYTVATEHNVMMTLRSQGIDANMWQTGGMNSACGINKANQSDDEGNYYLVTYDFDGDKLYWLGSYDEKGDYISDEEYSTEGFEDLVAYVLQLKDVKRIK